MNSIKFYGKRKSEELEDEKLTKLISTQENRMIEKIQFSVLHPSSKKITFAKQASAVEYRGADTSQTIFSWEYTTGGVRQFLVTSPQSFWNFYKDETRRHYYEVIAESFPCKLYLDVEFKIEDNLDKDGNDLVDNLIEMMIKFIKLKLAVDITKEDVLILDSTSPSKFSNHLIFTNLVFSDNFQTGRFINDFLSNLTADESALLKVKKGDEELWFIDTAVYTKNRNFRLFLSSKYGKKEILEVSENDLFTIKLIEDNFTDAKFDREKTLFFKSLVTLVDDLPVVDYSLQNGVQILKAKKPRARKMEKSDRMEGDREKSPYPEIDQFILALVQPAGFIRKWKVSEDANSITYEIGGNRFCGNISREHKSNNIKYVCSLEAETANQRCHDPECRDYKGPDIKIPDSLLPWKYWSDDDLLESSS